MTREREHFYLHRSKDSRQLVPRAPSFSLTRWLAKLRRNNIVFLREHETRRNDQTNRPRCV